MRSTSRIWWQFWQSGSGWRPTVATATLGFVLIVCAVIVGMETSHILQQRTEEIVDGRRDNENLLKSLLQHAELTFRTADTLLTSVVERLEHGDLAPPGGRERIASWFQNEVAQNPELRGFAVVDQRGELIVCSEGDWRPSDNSAREYFQHHAGNASRGLYIGAPIRPRNIRDWVIPVSRRFDKADGSFGGVAVVLIRPGYFQNFYQQLDIGKEGAILLASRSGKLLVRRPFEDANVGKDMSLSGIFAQLQTSRSGSVEIRSSTDGVVRLNSYQESDLYPVVLAVAQSTNEILAPWRARAVREALNAAIVVLVIALLGLFVRNMASRLSGINGLFEVALSNMPNGLVMFDAEKRVVISNQRFRDMYGLQEEEVRPGTPLRKLLEVQRRNGQIPALSIDEYLDAVDMPTQTHALADGRTVFTRRNRIPDGGWIATHEDITDRARNEQKIAYLAEHDLLTGLPNRAFLTKRLEGAIQRPDNVATDHFAVFMLDLDRFKNVNDTLGHAAGDQLLIEVARRLKGSLRDSDILARLGGDEFAIIQPLDSEDNEAAIALALRIIDTIARPIELNGHQVTVGTSIGIARSPSDGRDPKDLLKKADLALYAAKADGRNDFRLYRPEMMKDAEAHKIIENELREAIGKGDFELHYQPIVDVRSQTVCGGEALVRWRHPQQGLVGPDEFIPIAEASGLITPLGDWILLQACKDAASWPEALRVSVNLSAFQFNKGNLFDVVLCALVESGLNPERLELEITESALLDNQASHLQTIRQLKNLGITMALDDFGTGYSSASYLTNFPFDKIKIDKSFIQGAEQRRDCAAVIASVLALARGLEMAVTAEGVETEHQFQMLRNAGVEYAQGFLFARPVPQARFMAEFAVPLRVEAVPAARAAGGRTG